MGGFYEDPFAYDGSDFNAFLGQDHFASGSSPEDYHVTSATEPHFPAAIHHAHALNKAASQQQLLHHHQPFPSPTDPLSHSFEFDHAPHPQSSHLQFARSVPTSFPHHAQQQPPPDLPINTTIGNLSWNATPTTTTTATTATTLPAPGPNPPSSSLSSLTPESQLPTDPTALRTLALTLQSELSHLARERDEARLRLSTARNELYAARQEARRLRSERDGARSQAEFLNAERVKGRQNEVRLRRERNEARLGLAAALGANNSGNGKGAGGGSTGGVGEGVGNGRGGVAGVRGRRISGVGHGNGHGGGKGQVASGLAGGSGMAGVVMMAVDSQGEESGESPPMGAGLDQHGSGDLL